MSSINVGDFTPVFLCTKEIIEIICQFTSIVLFHAKTGYLQCKIQSKLFDSQQHKPSIKTYIHGQNCCQDATNARTVKFMGLLIDSGQDGSLRYKVKHNLP